MRILWLMVLTLCCGTLSAEEGNPYLSLSAPEIRSRIAGIDPLFREQSWYQVEVIAFARQQPAANEYWRLDQQPQLDRASTIRPDHQDVTLPEQADDIDRQAVNHGAWRWLQAEQLNLNDMIARMERDGDYRILLHTGWRQPMRERGRAFPVLITGGDALPPARPAPVPDQESLDEPATKPVPALNPTLEYDTETDEETIRQAPFSEPEFQGTLRLHLARYLHVEPEVWLARESDEGQRYWVKIDQKRRMRGEELHYLDHPLFGLLLRLTPWQTPEQEDLEKLEKALKSKQKNP